MAPLTALSNPLATPDQLATSSSQLDGVPCDLEESIHFAATRLTQAAGILLRLPQDIIAQAIVIFTRFWVGPEGGSLRQYGAAEISAACMYLMAKLSAHPQSPRSVLNVYAYLLSAASPLQAQSTSPPSIDPETYYLSEGAYLSRRTTLMVHEAIVLRTLGFDTHVALPYTLAINYLQALDALAASTPPETARELSRRVFAHLNTALLSPQRVALTHQPAALAAAAIYLAAREVGVRLPTAGEEGGWWEVFDVEREELGFLVVAMRSVQGFGEEERAKWGRREVPLTVEEVDDEIERKKILGEGGGE